MAGDGGSRENNRKIVGLKAGYIMKRRAKNLPKLLLDERQRAKKKQDFKMAEAVITNSMAELRKLPDVEPLPNPREITTKWLNDLISKRVKYISGYRQIPSETRQEMLEQWDKIKAKAVRYVVPIERAFLHHPGMVVQEQPGGRYIVKNAKEQLEATGVVHIPHYAAANRHYQAACKVLDAADELRAQEAKDGVNERALPFVLSLAADPEQFAWSWVNGVFDAATDGEED